MPSHGFTSDRLWLSGLLLLALAVRSGVLLAMRENLAQDPDAYRQIAENLLRHGVFDLRTDGKPTPTAYRPPLYPVVLSNLPAAGGQEVSLLKVAVLHVLLGVGTVWLTWLTARRLLRGAGVSPAQHELFSDESPALGPFLAGLLVACDPILLNQSTLVMTETLAAFLAILALWCLARYSAHQYWWNAVLAGGAIGLAILCRPTFLPWLGLVAAAMLLDFRFWILDWRQWGRRVANVAALAIAAAAVMSPWVIRNQRDMGRPIVTTTHGGYTLWLGNNPDFYEYLRRGDRDVPWSSDATRNYVEVLQESTQLERAVVEVVSDEEIYELAYVAMRSDPWGCCRASLYRIVQLWSPLPHQLSADESAKRTALRYATAAWCCGVYLLAAIGIGRWRWKLVQPPWVWGVLLCLTFTAVHTLYWCNLRMRAPLMPFVAIVAAAALVGQASRLSKN